MEWKVFLLILLAEILIFITVESYWLTDNQIEMVFRMEMDSNSIEAVRIMNNYSENQQQLYPYEYFNTGDLSPARHRVFEKSECIDVPFLPCGNKI